MDHIPSTEDQAKAQDREFYWNKVSCPHKNDVFNELVNQEFMDEYCENCGLERYMHCLNNSKRPN